VQIVIVGNLYRVAYKLKTKNILSLNPAQERSILGIQSSRLLNFLLFLNTMAQRVIHFELQADNIERAKAFYEKCFDWKIEQMMTKEQGGMDYWGLTTGPAGTPGINGGMYQRSPENPLHTYDCTIQVDDIDKAIEMVKANGGIIRKEKMEIPHVGWFAGATDTEGNIFGIMQPTEWKAS